MILMLEDDPDRLVRFRTVLSDLAPNIPAHFWRNADQMIVESAVLLSSATVICLDHDLEPEHEGIDPGDGYMVVKWLTAQPTIIPVVIHTSNRERSEWMAGEFDLAGWRYWRVSPLGDDWIEIDWRRRIQRILNNR